MNDMKQKDNTMRETPETDAAFRDGYTFCAEDMMPAVAFCANLERERDEARELARELRDKLLAVYDLPDDCPCAISNDALAAWHDVGIVLAKAKEVLGET